MCADDRRDAGHRRGERDRAARRSPPAGECTGSADVNAPGPLSIVKLICVPSGAFSKPRRAVVHVDVRRERVRSCRPRFVAVGGVIWMFASTNVLTASAEFGAMPSVCDRERRRARRPSSVEVACPVTVPAGRRGEGDRALAGRVRVRRRRSCRCPVGAGVRGAVRVGQRDVDVLARGRRRSRCRRRCPSASVTVNVCGWPTTLVAFGVIVILAFTQRLVAGPEFAAEAVRRARQRDAADRHASSRRSPCRRP